MSNSAQPLLWGAAGGVLALALYIAVDQWLAPSIPDYTSPTVTAEQPAQVVKPLNATTTITHSTDPLPQQSRPRISSVLPSRTDTVSMPTNAVAPNDATALIAQQKAAQEADKMDSIQTRLASLMQQNPLEIDINKLDGVLADLQKLKGNGDYVGQVNIAQVRQNLATSQEVVLVTQELEAAAKRGASAEEMSVFHEQLLELQKNFNPMVIAPQGITQ